MSELEFSLAAGLIFGGPVGLVILLAFTPAWPVWLIAVVGYLAGLLITMLAFTALIEAEACLCGHLRDSPYSPHERHF